jgi:histone-lysine N-methyltransferase SETMAR
MAGMLTKASSCTTTRGPTPRLAQMLYSNSSTGRFFDHPPYSPDLAPIDCHLFTKMKVWLATSRFHTDEDLMDGVNNWLHNLTAPFFDEGLQKLVSRYEKFLNVDGNYVEK